MPMASPTARRVPPPLVVVDGGGCGVGRRLGEADVEALGGTVGGAGLAVPVREGAREPGGVTEGVDDAETDPEGDALLPGDADCDRDSESVGVRDAVSETDGDAEGE